MLIEMIGSKTTTLSLLSLLAKFSGLQNVQKLSIISTTAILLLKQPMIILKLKKKVLEKINKHLYSNIVANLKQSCLI